MNKKIGILNKGKNNKFLKNKFSKNLDIGIQDEGEGTVAEGNDFGVSGDDDISSKPSYSSNIFEKLPTVFYWVAYIPYRVLNLFFRFFKDIALSAYKQTTNFLGRLVFFLIMILVFTFFISLSK